LISLDSENLDPLRVDSPQEPGRVAFTPDGLLVVASEAGLIVRQPTDATHVQRYRRRTGEPADAGRLDFLAVQPTGELILQSESRSESIKLWSRLDLRTVATFPVPNATREIAFSPNGRFFAVTADLETRIYEIRGCDVRSIFAPGIHFPFTFGLNRDRDEIALVDETFLSSLRLWNLDEVEPWRGGERFFGDHGDHRLLRLLPPRSDLPAVAVRKFQDTTITVHDLLNPFSKPLKIAEGESLAVARDPTGRIWMTVEDRLYLLSSDGKLAGSWRNPFAEMLSGKGGLNSLGMGNRYVVVGGRDGYMRLFETAQSTPRPTKQHRVGTSPLKSAAVLQDRWAFFGTESGELVVLNLPDGERLARVEASLERLDQLAVTEKGLIASGGRSGDLKLWHWDGSLLKLVMALPVSGSVLQLEFDSDGRRLIARIEGEAALRVWHLERLCAQLHQHGIDSGIENLLPPKGGTKSIPERLRMPRKIEPFAEGEPKGLIAELFNDPNLHTVVKVRYEDSISFNWGEGSPDPLLQHDDFSIRWSGWLKAPKPGRYQLQVHSIGGFRIWIDGKRILDQWPTFSGESPAIGVMLTGGPQSIRIEYREVRGPAKFRLNWANGDPAMPRFFPTREAACNNAEFGIRNAE
jgi:WD40 repeat protein